MTPPSYRRLFQRSAEHLWLAVGTIGLGFASGEPLGLLIGLVAYAIGQIYLPDSGWFRQRSDRRRASADAAADAAELAAFNTHRDQLRATLTAERRARYEALVAVCADISAAGSTTDSAALALSIDTRLRKLDELLWTYLRLLNIGQSLETYLETERREDLDTAAARARADVADLEAELGAAPAGANAPLLETRRKLLASRRDRLLALEQRLARVAQARANLELARSEQDRLVEQAKLIRADAVAKRNAESLGTRIDLSIEHLAETNRWLSDLADFNDLTAQLPPLPPGAMLTPAAPPPVPGRHQPTRQPHSRR